MLAAFNPSAASGANVPPTTRRLLTNLIDQRESAPLKYAFITASSPTSPIRSVDDRHLVRIGGNSGHGDYRAATSALRARVLRHALIKGLAHFLSEVRGGVVMQDFVSRCRNKSGGAIYVDNAVPGKSFSLHPCQRVVFGAITRAAQGVTPSSRRHVRPSAIQTSSYFAEHAGWSARITIVNSGMIFFIPP